LSSFTAKLFLVSQEPLTSHDVASTSCHPEKKFLTEDVILPELLPDNLSDVSDDIFSDSVSDSDDSVREKNSAPKTKLQ
jgi:hypothetical protein